MSSLSMTAARSDLPLRAGVALLLAALVHITAWTTLVGIRVLLPAREAPAPKTIEAALLAPAPTPIALPTRRAVVRAAPARAAGEPAPLTAVSAASAPAREAAPSVSAPAPSGAPASAAPGPGAPPAQPAVDATRTPSNVPAAASPAAPAGASPTATGAPSGASTPPAGAPAPVPPAAAAAATVAPAAAVPPAKPATVVLPKSARLVYSSYGTVRAGGFVLGVRGRTTIRWQFKDGHYQSDLSIDIVDFKQSSQGRFDPDVGLEPERYSETRPRHPTSTTQFDWTNHRVSFTDDARPGTADPGAQDRLSIQFQLSVLRQVYPELFARGTVVPITLAGTRDISHWTFTVTGDDIVDSGLGHIPALRVLTTRTTGTGEESLEVWISQRLNWFPARIRMVDKNRNVLDFVLDEATLG